MGTSTPIQMYYTQRQMTTAQDKLILRKHIIQELNSRCSLHLDMETSDQELMQTYNTLEKGARMGFFTAAALELKRPNERVFQIFKNMLKPIRYQEKMNQFESISIHNYALMNKRTMTVKEIQEQTMKTTLKNKSVDPESVYTLIYKACMPGAQWRALPQTSLDMNKIVPQTFQYKVRKTEDRSVSDVSTVNASQSQSQAECDRQEEPFFDCTYEFE